MAAYGEVLMAAVTLDGNCGAKLRRFAGAPDPGGGLGFGQAALSWFTSLVSGCSSWSGSASVIAIDSTDR